MAVLLVALVLLFALGILGAVVKGLLWLTLVAVILFVLGGAFGASKLRNSKRT